MQPGGYHNQYLSIDVGSGQSASYPLPEHRLRRFLGGSGLGTLLILPDAEVDPLAPEAPLAFVFSPLVGSPLTTSAKFAVVCKSPLTDRLNDSLASSGFAMAGKRTGFDAIVLRGRARQPSVVVIDEDRVQVVPAGDVWGQPCAEAEKRLLARFGPSFRAATIGPAGEHLVRFATISHDGRHAGRGGSGAVLGSKNIKAVLVRGARDCRWSSPESMYQLAKELSTRSFGPATDKYRELGTASNLLVFNRLHALPTRNFQQGSFESAEQIAPESLSIARKKTRAYCAACTIGCEHIYQLGPGEGKGVRIEYENLFALGPLCGVSDADTVLRACQLCDQLGLDTISTGGTIAFAMECVERGLMPDLSLSFGDTEGLLQMIEAIAYRRDQGDALAEGSRRLASRLGAGTAAFAAHVKGLEIPGYEPRALQTMALGLAVASRGADHNRSSAYEADFSEHADRRNLQPENAVLAVEAEDRAALLDSLILCKFLRGVFEDLYAESAQMLRLATGWDVTADELRATAARVVAAKKLFNIRAGWTPDEDTLPDRFLEQPLADDPQARLTRATLNQAILAYNRHRGWTDEGYLTPSHLHQMQLSDV